MEIIIRDRWNGDPIYTAKDVENVFQAVTEAIGRGKSLSGADLSGATLYGANLSRADLSRANLYGAENISKYITSPLYMLLDQVGEIRAYKLVTEECTGPWHGSINYEIGQTYTEPGFCSDEQEQRAAGINLATLDWCLKEWRPGYRIFIASFKRKFGNEDNICVPIGSDGKFRVRSCKIISEVDLQKIGFLNEKGERV